MTHIIRQLNNHSSISGSLRFYDFVQAKYKDVREDPYLSNINKNGWRVSHKGVYMSFKLELIK